MGKVETGLVLIPSLLFTHHITLWRITYKW